MEQAFGEDRIDMTRAICVQARAAVLAIRDKWFAGNPIIPDDPAAPEVDSHQASSRRGSRPLLHVDRDYLTASSSRGLAELLLHEGWHLAGFANHGPTEGPIYSTYPYSEAQSCVLG